MMGYARIHVKAKNGTTYVYNSYTENKSGTNKTTMETACADVPANSLPVRPVEVTYVNGTKGYAVECVKGNLNTSATATTAKPFVMRTKSGRYLSPKEDTSAVPKITVYLQSKYRWVLYVGTYSDNRVTIDLNNVAYDKPIKVTIDSTTASVNAQHYEFIFNTAGHDINVLNPNNLNKKYDVQSIFLNKSTYRIDTGDVSINADTTNRIDYVIRVYSFYGGTDSEPVWKLLYEGTGYNKVTRSSASNTTTSDSITKTWTGTYEDVMYHINNSLE